MREQKNNWIVGFCAFLLVVLFKPAAIFEQSWAELLLVYGVLVLAPIALHLYLSIAVPNRRLVLEGIRVFELPMAFLFAIAFYLPAGGLATVLLVPWLLFSYIVALDALVSLTRSATLSQKMAAVGAIFFAVGPTWALFDRAAYPFLGYDAALVLLTAVHFHFAGFFFPMLLAYTHQKLPNRWSKAAIYLFVIGVPLTAVGISMGHFYQNYHLESVSASFVVSGVVLLAFCQAILAKSSQFSRFTSFCLFLSSFLFLFAMVLALFYAFRMYMQWPFFTIPNLRFWHGTANALAVSLAYIAWWPVAGNSKK